MKRYYIITILFAVSLTWAALPADADIFDEERSRMQNELNSFRKQTKEEFESFRDQINKEYADALRNPWENIKVDPIIVRAPEPEPVPPIWIDDDSTSPLPIRIKDTVIPPDPQPQPTPIIPINPVITPNPVTASITFYGTPIKFTEHNWNGFSLSSIDESSIASGWNWLSNRKSNSFIADLLNQRNSLNLPDWGYLLLVDNVVGKYHIPKSPEHTVMMAYILSQSGYKVRIAKTDKELNLFFACSGILYDHVSLTIDSERYWSYNKLGTGSVKISNVRYPGEQGMSMNIPKSPNFIYKAGNKRDITVKNFPDVNLSVTVNKNLIDFYNNYPASTLDDTPYSRWANIAQTPVSIEIENSLYDKLRPYVAGKSQRDAINFLLKVAQSFPYGFDNDEWGEDRAFWIEETWHYPLSDCEDHAIHFVKMVNAVLGLNTALVFYPGHLYSAIESTDGTLTGDYIIYDGKKYIVCDPTYFYAPAGKTAPNMNNAEAVLIPIR